jgi:hypothetical protein
MAGSCEHGNESLGSIKGREFLDWLTVLLAEVDQHFRGTYCLYHQDDNGGSTHL